MKSNTPIEVTKIDGKICVRTVGMPQGIFYKYDHKIDSLLAHAQRELSPVIRSPGHLCVATGIPHAAVCRIKRVGGEIPEAWFLRLNEFSGIPVEELRRVAVEPAKIERHPLARRMKAERNKPRARKSRPGASPASIFDAIGIVHRI